MLKSTPHGVQLYRDWKPAMIGKAIPRPFPSTTPDDDRVQAALLGVVKRQPMDPIPVRVLDTVERLAEFLNR